MARPRKEVGEKRTLIIRVRVTPTEKESLDKAAEDAGFTVSDFVRVKAVNAVPRIRKATPERAAFIHALSNLSKMGSNINQIARALNRRQESGNLEGVSIDSILRTLENVDTLSEALLKLAEHGH